MPLVKILKDNLGQIFAITEKNIKMNLRYKFNMIFSLIYPIIAIIMPIIILNKFFEFNAKFGPWNETNFLVFLFMAYNITLLSKLITVFPSQFKVEKYWYTLQSIIIAPFNRINLLFGILISELIMISIPFTVFITLCYLYYPISLSTLLMIFSMFFMIALLFSGTGLILGVFAISNENLLVLLNFIISIIIMFSCITFPYQIFPKIIQNFVDLNPLYYIFDVIRLTWIEDNVLHSIYSHSFHFILLISLSISMPIIGVICFNLIYKKYGIVGY
ncbi:MAG: ABC transporter permease [Promethearchaeota archaeon]